jgi:5-methylcytosine-specific restriction endonuclease McrA
MTKGSDARSDRARAYRRLYKTSAWQSLRDTQLSLHPLCLFCAANGRATIATVVDHIRPHRGDPSAFFDINNIQSLCDAYPWRCHSVVKQEQERIGYSSEVGLDGWPIDAAHRSNKRSRGG